MKIAIEGCAHGELENIYRTIQNKEQRDNIKVELLICCGDFQSTRNIADLQTMAVPDKFKDIGSFYKYYSGELVAPFLTIFIGGNHEASNYLQELPYGGWVAPNIYYLGYAGVIRVNGIRIAGISGIYKGFDFLRGRHEFPPYSQSTIRSVYHVRQIDVFRLKQLSGAIDVFISHDWPRGVYNYGNKDQLIRFKPHFRDEIFSNTLGSRPCEDLLQTLKPDRWFAAHLHCQFTATVPHYADNDNGGDDEADNDEPTHCTEFLALDKCLPRRRFLQIMDIETKAAGNDCDKELVLEHDAEWLSVLYLTNHLISVKNATYYMPGPRGGSDERYNFTPTEEEIQNVVSKFNGDLRIPKNFCYTVPAYDPKQGLNFSHTPQPKAQINPQTTQFCDTLGIDDPLSLAMIIGGHELNHSTILDNSATSSFNESGTSSTSDLNSSVNLWNISNCSFEGSPSPRKVNMSLKLPTPVKPQAINFTLPLMVKKPTSALNTDEIELGDSDGSDGEEEIVDKQKVKDVVESSETEIITDADKIAELPVKTDAEKNTETEENTEPPIKLLKRHDESVDKAEDERSKAEETVEQVESTIPTTPTKTEPTNLENSGRSQTKVFKRRNQHIYAQNPDEENDS